MEEKVIPLCSRAGGNMQAIFKRLECTGAERWSNWLEQEGIRSVEGLERGLRELEFDLVDLIYSNL